MLGGRCQGCEGRSGVDLDDGDRHQLDVKLVVREGRDELVDGVLRLVSQKFQVVDLL